MGTKIKKPPIHYGSDCTRCNELCWEAGETPMYMFAHFEHMVSCGPLYDPPPNGSTFLLQQSPVNSCIWQYSSDTWQIDYQPVPLGEFYSIIRMFDNGGIPYFTGIGDPCPPEVAVFSHYYSTCVPLLGAKGGFCYLAWHDNLQLLIDAFGIDQHADLRHEMRGHPDGDIVQKLCNLYQRTNIKFKLPP